MTCDSEIDGPPFDHSALLAKVATYYPKAYTEHKLSAAQPWGRGTQAFVFALRGKIWKFTSSRSHAKVAVHLSNSPGYQHLVCTDQVWYLPVLDLWCVVEQQLFGLDLERHARVQSWLCGDVDPPEDINNMLKEFESIGLSGWEDDCIHPHNLMEDGNGRLVAHDFGHTDCDLPDVYSTWT